VPAKGELCSPDKLKACPAMRCAQALSGQLPATERQLAAARMDQIVAARKDSDVELINIAQTTRRKRKGKGKMRAHGGGGGLGGGTDSQGMEPAKIGWPKVGMIPTPAQHPCTIEIS